jgi:subtilisin family serine protease
VFKSDRTLPFPGGQSRQSRWVSLPDHGRPRPFPVRGFATFAARLWLAMFLGVLPAFAAFHPHRILIKPRDFSRLAALQQWSASRGDFVERSFPGQGHLQVVRLRETDSVEAAVARYRASGLVEFAEPDYVVAGMSLSPSDPHFQTGTQWGLNNYGQNAGVPDADIDAPEGWDVLHDASNVVVAVVDSGMRYTHEDLLGNLWTNPLDGTHGFNALANNHDPQDDNGHGTHVAGIIGAVTGNGKGVAGVAWRVQLMACKFLDSAGFGTNSDAIACIEFARTHGARVINLSWGGNDFSAAVSNALWLARADGIIIVAAAGNSARNTDTTAFYPAGIELDNIVAVGASTRTDNLWGLSNYGATSVDLFAPGAAIYSTGSSSDAAYLSRDGSSMASAFVAGAFALLRQREPTAAVSQLIGRLLAAVDRPATFSGKCVTGGRLNLRKALDQPSIAVGALPFELRVSGAAAHRYTLEASTNLVTWSALRTNLADPNGQWNFLDADSTNLPARFYRASPAP